MKLKLTKIFGLVALLHVLGIGILLVQPGCQTANNQHSGTSPDQTKVSDEPVVEIEKKELHPDFNAGFETQKSKKVSSSKNRYPPTRPSWTYKPETEDNDEEQYVDDENTEVLEPLDFPVTESIEDEVNMVSYKVRKGDSLWKIAKKHNVSLNAILEENNLTKDSIINVGQLISIPKYRSEVTESTKPLNDGIIHNVIKGESLSKISKRYNTSVKDIKRANNLLNDLIKTGQKLVIPGVYSISLAEETEPDVAVETITEDGYYIVNSGDALVNIANRLNVKLEDLVAINNIENPKKLQIGQKLKIPGNKVESSNVVPEVEEENVENVEFEEVIFEEESSDSENNDTPTVEDLKSLLEKEEGSDNEPVIPADESNSEVLK